MLCFVCLLSLSIIILDSSLRLHVSAAHPFLLLSSTLLYGYTVIYLYILLLMTSGLCPYSCCLWTLLYKFMYGHRLPFFLAEWLGQAVSESMFKFLRNCQAVFQFFHFPFPPTMYQSSCSCTSWPQEVYFLKRQYLLDWLGKVAVAFSYFLFLCPPPQRFSFSLSTDAVISLLLRRNPCNPNTVTVL